MNYILRIFGISLGVGAGQQHLKRDVWYLLPQFFETSPGTLVQEGHGDIEGFTTPYLEVNDIP